MADIELCLTETLIELANQTKLAIESGDAQISTEFETSIDEINNKLDALTSQDLAEQLAALKSLVDSLDLDEDSSVVNDLLNIKSIAEQALDAALLAGTNADSANEKADNLLTALTEYQNTNNLRVAANEAVLADHTIAIAELKACCLSAVTQADIDTSISANNDKICAALAAGVVSFTQILQGDSGSGSGSDDII